VVDDLAASWQANQQVATSYARRLVGDDDADDVVSDAFARILARSTRCGPVEKFRSYLLTVIRSIAIDRGRRPDEVLATELTLTRIEVDRGDMVEAPDLAETELLRAALASLPDHQRAVLLASEVDGASHSDIAEATGSNPNAVAALSYRARESLRRAYLAAHLHVADGEPCRQAQDLIPAYVRGTLAPRQQPGLEAHLASCTRCAADVDTLHHLAARMPHLAGTRSRALSA
jgi:RNA polymerase sigma factor (sigma-70 family)